MTATCLFVLPVKLPPAMLNNKLRMGRFFHGLRNIFALILAIIDQTGHSAVSYQNFAVMV
jgi:hypothetical protein